MKNMILILCIMTLSGNFLMGQEPIKPKVTDSSASVNHDVKAERRWGDGGVGIGLDYGGLIGVKATFYPIPYMGVFGAVGWELIDIGWNVGCLGRILPADGKHAARPYLKAMYGVNGVTKVEGKSVYDKLFYGFTAGIGLETRFGKKKKSGINLDLNVPFRSPEYFHQISQMKNDPQIKMTNSPLPIAISIGYSAEF
jgi:hypothetical protein